MSEMKFTLPGSETVTLTGQAIDKLICAGDGDAALLYLYILKTRGQRSSTEAAVALGKNAGGIASAMNVLSHLGLVNMDERADNSAASKKSPGITGNSGVQASSNSGLRPVNKTEEVGDAQRRRTVGDMKRELETGSVFYAIVEEAQRRLGNMLSPEDLMRLFGMYDNLSLEPEVILQLITHCISENRAKNGGRMPSIRYIEKAAYTWDRAGVHTLENAEKYLKALDVRRSVQSEIKKTLNIWNREFTETESRYVDNWISMGFGASAVAIAYDRTILKTGKLVWNYMDTIINSWHSKGLHAPHEIQAKDKMPERGVTETATKAAHGKKFGEANHEEVQRMQRLLNKIKEG